MAEPDQHIRKHGEEALAALRELPDSKPMDATKQRLDDAIRELVHMRDGLIAAQRAGESLGDWLPRTNAILSTIFGTEYPIAGLSQKRIEESCSALQQLLNDKPPLRGARKPAR